MYLSLLSTPQVILLLTLLFKGAGFFNVHKGDFCNRYSLKNGTGKYVWDPVTTTRINTGDAGISCQSFSSYCPGMTEECYHEQHKASLEFNSTMFSFGDLEGYGGFCLECDYHSYTHTTIIFNAFVFCQLFNEFNARSLFDDSNVFRGLCNNPIFIAVIIMTVFCQYFIVTFGGDFTRTSPLNPYQWAMTILFALGTFPVGFLMRQIPCKEDPKSFFDNSEDENKANKFHAGGHIGTNIHSPGFGVEGGAPRY